MVDREARKQALLADLRALQAKWDQEDQSGMAPSVAPSESALSPTGSPTSELPVTTNLIFGTQRLSSREASPEEV